MDKLFTAEELDKVLNVQVGMITSWNPSALADYCNAKVAPLQKRVEELEKLIDKEIYDAGKCL